jgi:hypothetical protein
VGEGERTSCIVSLEVQPRSTWGWSGRWRGAAAAVAFHRVDIHVSISGG